MKKKILALLILCMVVFAFGTMGAYAEKDGYFTCPEGVFPYFDTTIDNGEITINGFSNLAIMFGQTPSHLVIPAEIDGYPVTKIGNGAFEDFDQEYELTKVNLPNTITHIGSSAFYCCWGITEFTIPESVTHIDGWAFSGCQLKELKIPAGVVYIGGPLSRPYSYFDIVVDENNMYYSSIDGVLFDKNKTTLIDFAGGPGNFVVPEGVTTIGMHAFEERAFSNLTLPSTITDITGAFGLPLSEGKIGTITYNGTKSDWNKISGANLDDDGLFWGDSYSYANVVFNIQKDFAEISGTTSANVGATNVLYTVTLATIKDDVSYATVFVKYPKELFLSDIESTDFTEVEISKTTTSGDYKTSEILCTYSYDGTTMTKGAPCEFNLYFDVAQTATPGDIVLEITNSSVLMGSADYPFETTVNAEATITPKLPERITISGSSNIDTPTQYTATVLPDYTTDKSVIWSVNDESVATISQDGILTPVTSGTVIITATAASNTSVKATKSVTVIGGYASLDTLTSDGYWPVAFSPEVTNYTVFVDEDTATFNLSATYQLGSLKMNGSTVLSGRSYSVDLTSDETTITLNRTNVPGYTDNIYILTIIKDNSFIDTYSLECSAEKCNDNYTVSVCFNRSIQDSAILIAAFYGEGNQLIRFETSDVTSSDTQKTITFTKNASMPDVTYVKVMLWDNLTDMNALCDSVTVDEFTEPELGKLRLTSQADLYLNSIKYENITFDDNNTLDAISLNNFN